MKRGSDAQTQRLWDSIRARHPHFVHAVIADAKVTARHRGERNTFRSRADATTQALRLMCVSDAFFAQVCYRAKARWQNLGVPALPRLAHRVAMMTSGVCIGDPVVMQPGVCIPHGQVVIDGIANIDRDTVIYPWVTIGLRGGNFQGPTIERGVTIGSGAKVIGPVSIGAKANIGADAVVVADVSRGQTVIGAPARPVHPVNT